MALSDNSACIGRDPSMGVRGYPLVEYDDADPLLVLLMLAAMPCGGMPGLVPPEADADPPW